ncbi:glycoside hydrolase family 95 protein [Cryobacterium sp. SO2]|uniref:glycoside hydrolase family 95 protein n=1 Tax=Cryobacterium sp. SO2 TaxID=1897060 RepID=UPI00223E30EC|nr:glycoside hydrolase family 95 protein [Cryobacterium sp. SO2]WEO77291.1 glycoside hydrolase family 95 protein [Cryobacterium sp. SO2]
MRPDRTLPDETQVLWYGAPATVFTEALPLGNGRIGAMCFGGIGVDKIRLNDDTAWSGSMASELRVLPQSAEDNKRALRHARDLIGDNEYGAAEVELAGLSQPYTQAYMPFADLIIEIDDLAGVQHYRRSLDLRTASHDHGFDTDHGRIDQRMFVSAAHNVLVVDLRVGALDGVTVRVRLASQLKVDDARQDSSACGLTLRLPSDVPPTHADPPAEVQYSDDPTISVQGAVVAHWQHDGTDIRLPAGATTAGLAATGVHRLQIYLSTATTFTGVGLAANGSADEAYARANEAAVAAGRLGVDTLWREHRAEHAAFYERVTLDLGRSASTATAPLPTCPLPTDQRVLQTPRDPALAALMFNYGRYLLISSSRPGSLAATLQGLWNESMTPPWSSNYTLNINTQMNYWAAESTALAECHEPFFELIEALSRNGRGTAQRLYGLPGWVAHHNTDAWAFTSPVAGDPAWSFWPLAPAWLVRHFFEHLRHGGDPEFARTRAWPVIRGACEFILGWLVRQPDGSLGTVPSTSPENHFTAPDGRPAAAARSSTADIAMIRALFEAALGIGPEDDAIMQQVVRSLAALPPIPISDGSIQEWADPFVLPEPGHRHVSPLYFAYPGNTLLTPELAAAVSRTLDERGDDSAGWSLVWKIALRARLREPEAVERLLPLVFRSVAMAPGPWEGGLYPNLFVAHPPFQIDGNLGYVAAVVECLVHSHADRIDLLPAVPASWPAGSVAGLVVRPGVLVDIDWAPDTHGRPRLVRARLRARTVHTSGAVKVGWHSIERTVKLTTDSWVELTEADFPPDS